MPIGATVQRLLRHGFVLLGVVVLAVVLPRVVAHAAPGQGQLVSRRVAILSSTAVIDGQVVSEPPTGAPGVRPALTVLVQHGDTVASLASAVGGDVAAVRWANALTGTREPAPGSSLLVPPGPGALVAAGAGETPSELAARIGVDPHVVLEYNSLQSDAPLPAGTFVQVPAGNAPSAAIFSSDVVQSEPGVPAVDPSQYRRASAGRFPWGQCTYWVWTKRYVPWDGNADMWYANARAAGRPEGQVPVQGAIAVFDTGYVGHVAFVEKVDPDGTFTVSEMNEYGLGMLDERVLSTSSPGLLGFIY